MALRITKANEPVPVDRTVTVIYSAPGLGKTTLAFTADRPLLFDFDGGSYRAGNRGDVVRIGSWGEVVQVTADDLAGYKTAVVDTVGRALDHLSAALIADDPKLGKRSGELSLPGYGALRTAFSAWLSRLKQTGLDVVLISHMDEQRKGDDVLERLDIQGSTKNEIYKSADAMGRLYLQNGKRILNFSPSDVGFGKNPAGFEPMAVPDFNIKPDFLATVIASLKAKLNEESGEQAKVRQALDEARETFAKLGGADEFNAVLPTLSNADEKVKRLLLDIAAGKGLAFDRKAKAFKVAA